MANKFFVGMLAMVLVFGMTVVGCGEEETGPYYMEIYNISSSTFDTLMSDYNSANKGTDAFNFVRAQSGSNKRSTHNHQTLEEVKQRLLGDLEIPTTNVNAAISSLQQGRSYYIWSRNDSRTIFIHVGVH